MPGAPVETPDLIGKDGAITSRLDGYLGQCREHMQRELPCLVTHRLAKINRFVQVFVRDARQQRRQIVLLRPGRLDDDTSLDHTMF